MFDDAMAPFENAPRQAAAAAPARVVTFAWPEYCRAESPRGHAYSAGEQDAVDSDGVQDAVEGSVPDADEMPVQDPDEGSVQSFTAASRDS